MPTKDALHIVLKQPDSGPQLRSIDDDPRMGKMNVVRGKRSGVEGTGGRDESDEQNLEQHREGFHEVATVDSFGRPSLRVTTQIYRLAVCIATRFASCSNAHRT